MPDTDFAGRSGVARCVAERFPGDHPHTKAYRDHLEQALETFIESGRADPQFLTALCGTDDHGFWSRVSEALVAQRLADKVFGQPPKKGAGPDFLLLHEGLRLWVEVVCPEPIGVPSEWLDPQPGQGHSMPHRELLLRWTTAIHAKAQRLFTAPGKDRQGYLDGGLVKTTDAYVIAVNACRLRSGPFSSLQGISTFPFAAEAVFPFGPYEIKIDRDSLEVVDRGHQHRPQITKSNGASVPTAMFLDPKFRGVSAIWALDLNGGSAYGNYEPALVVHNPLATNPLPVGYLPAEAEYVATEEGDDYVLRKVERSDDAPAGLAPGGNA